MGKPSFPYRPQYKQYEYTLITKQPCLSELDELNLMGKQGWLVVTCPYPNTYLLVREKIDG
jgi:hypothetical protein